MKSNLTELWAEFKTMISTSGTFNAGLAKKDIIELHPDLLEILTMNNGQRIDNPGLFIRPRAGTLTSPSWTEFKFLDYDSIISILGQIRELDTSGQFSDEIPFAISGNQSDIGDSLTINSQEGTINIVSFGLMPENYDERDILRYVRSKEKFGSSMSDFILTQKVFRGVSTE